MSTWPEKMTVYVVMERINGHAEVKAVYSENQVAEALEWGKEQFDEFHAADPGRPNCAYLAKRHGVRVNLG